MIKNMIDNVNIVLENTNIESEIQARNELDKISRDIPFLERINMLPYFEPNSIDDLKGVYTESHTIKKLNENISYKEWYDSYKLMSKGIVSENAYEMTTAWFNKIKELYLERETCSLEEVSQINQNILALGWNPSLSFDYKTIYKVTANTKTKFNTFNNVYDIVPLVEDSSEDKEIIQEYPTKEPLYIVLVYTGSGFSKAIKRYTKGIYTHAGLSLDPDLRHIYSYNLQKNGFVIEELKDYTANNNASEMAVYTIYVNKKDMTTIRRQLDYYIMNKDKTKYSVLNIFGLMFNKPVESNNNMICSQFVDSILKSINMDITHKNSAIVSPHDLYLSLNPKIYKLFEGKVKDFNFAKVNKTIKIMTRISKPINESVVNEASYISKFKNNKYDIETLSMLCENTHLLSEDNKTMYNMIRPYLDIDYLNEVKEFPVQFDNDGNLLIRKKEKLDFDAEYSKSHKLLKIYEEHDNLEGMKYELSKLWFMNILLEKKIFSNTDENKSSYHKSRARILNDFNKYLKIVNSHEKNFNFYDYFNNSPFSDATIKVNKSTMYHGKNIITSVIKSLSVL